jgi:arylsulfatase A-like enzyme
MYPIDEMPVTPLLHARQRNAAQRAPGGDRLSRFDREDGERLAQRILAYYWGMQTFIDDMVGRIMETLTRRGLWENTLIIYTTDHGAMIGDFGQTGKGNFMEQVIRVPYIVVPPGGAQSAEEQPPRAYGGLVEHVDLVPTILDYAGLARPAELPGRSLRPVLEGRAGSLASKEFVICEHGTKDPSGGFWRRQSLRTERYKYVFSGADRAIEFYDLHQDPQELANVAGEPALAAEIRRHAELLIDHRLRTETNAWKCGLAGATPQPLDPFGNPTQAGGEP